MSKEKNTEHETRQSEVAFHQLVTVADAHNHTHTHISGYQIYRDANAYKTETR